MAIVATQRLTELRFFDVDQPTYFQPYKAVCNVTELDSDVVMITGLHGKLTRKNFAELVMFLLKAGYVSVLSQRSNGSGVPYSVEIQDQLMSPNKWWKTDLMTIKPIAEAYLVRCLNRG